MHYANLTRAQKKTYNDAITQGAHRRRIELHVLTLDGRLVRSLNPRITGGSITLDVDQMPMMVATVDFLDPSASLVFEPDGAGEAPVHRKYLLRLVDSRLIPGIGWVDVIVFTGPIWDFDRRGAIVSLTAHSVDRLASGTVRRAKMWRRKTKKTDIIKGLLQEAGATGLRIPDLRFTTPVHVHIRHVHGKKHDSKPHTVRRVTGFRATRQDTYWDKASGLGDSMNRLLFPTADGSFELRSHPERPVYHFNREIVTDPELTRPGSEAPNTFQVDGARPKGSKRRVTSGKVGFPNNHPLSASSLAWNSKPFEVLELDHNPHCKTKAECRKIAVRKRDRAARMLFEVTVEAMPIPWLRPWDLVTVQTGAGRVAVHVKQMSFPLTPDETPMVVGSTRRVLPPRWSVRGVA